MKTTWVYQPQQKETLKLSRSRLEMFKECRRCFWLLLRQNIKRPSMPDFLLNEAVDHLLKKEFDIYRQKKTAHPLMKQAKLRAVPFAHKDLDVWRNPFEGIQYLVEDYNFLIFGGVDDVWQNSDEELIVVDYKATAKDKAVTQLYALGGYHDAYRRQAEVYQWLLQKNDFKVNPTAYFVYATGIRGKERFSRKLEFELNLIAHEGSTDWIEPALKEVYDCLQADMPSLVLDKEGLPVCRHCAYVQRRLSLGAQLRRNRRPAK